MTNTENTPIEALDTHYPFRVERYTLRREAAVTAGSPVGRAQRAILFLADATLSLMGERRRHDPGPGRGWTGGHRRGPTHQTGWSP